MNTQGIFPEHPFAVTSWTSGYVYPSIQNTAMKVVAYVLFTFLASPFLLSSVFVDLTRCGGHALLFSASLLSGVEKQKNPEPELHPSLSSDPPPSSLSEPELHPSLSSDPPPSSLPEPELHPSPPSDPPPSSLPEPELHPSPPSGPLPSSMVTPSKPEVSRRIPTTPVTPSRCCQNPRELRQEEEMEVLSLLERLNDIQPVPSSPGPFSVRRRTLKEGGTGTKLLEQLEEVGTQDPLPENVPPELLSNKPPETDSTDSITLLFSEKGKALLQEHKQQQGIKELISKFQTSVVPFVLEQRKICPELNENDINGVYDKLVEIFVSQELENPANTGMFGWNFVTFDFAKKFNENIERLVALYTISQDMSGNSPRDLCKKACAKVLPETEENYDVKLSITTQFYQYLTFRQNDQVTSKMWSEEIFENKFFNDATWGRIQFFSTSPSLEELKEMPMVERLERFEADVLKMFASLSQKLPQFMVQATS